MNLKELDFELRRITQHEKDYQLGHQMDYLSLYASRNIDEKNVLYFSLRDIDPSKEGLFLMAKRHSRFQSFPAHCHNDIELNYMYSGSCTQIINGKKHLVKEGQLLFLNFDTVHEIMPLGENDILINLNIEREYLTSNFFNRFSSESIVMKFFLDALNKDVSHDDFMIFNSERNERIRIFISEFMCEWYNPSSVAPDIMNSLLTLILSELINVYKNDITHKTNSSYNNSVIEILHYIESNYKTCTLKSTAIFFNLNANYMSNLLKKTTGYTYKELILHQKINSAKQLLKNTSLSIVEISDKVGYQNVSFFYEKFKEIVGCLPGDYRKQNNVSM